MPAASQWTLGAFRLDPDDACLWHDTQEVMLKPKSFAVLHYLVAQAGRLVTKEELFAAVWPDTAIGDAVLKVCIAEVRKALGDTAKTPRFIATVHRRGYRFIAPMAAVEPPEARLPQLTTPIAPSSRLHMALQATVPLVERETVLDTLLMSFERASQGERQTVFVTGEPGIGKTAVVEAFLVRAANTPHVYIACGQCVEQYGAGEAYLPVLDALGQLCHREGGQHLIALLRQQAPTWLVQMPWLLTAADRERLQQELQGATRERMLRELAEALDVFTTERPLILVLEDLHWSDYATLDLLSLLARRRMPAQLLIIGTYRPVEVIAHGHPLHAVKQELQIHGHCAELPLAPLSQEAVAAYLVERFPGHHFPAEMAAWLHQHTDGNPLFLVTMAQALMERGTLKEQGESWALRGELEAFALVVPESLWATVEQQISRLPPEVQRVLEAASVAGVEFSAAAVAAGIEAEAREIEEHCEALTRHQILRSVGVAAWPDGTVAGRYAFGHALYQQLIYQQLGEARRVRLHLRIGARMEKAYDGGAGEIAAELAKHFVRGRETRRAVQYLRQAAETAARRYAHREVIMTATRAIELLATLPDTPERAQQELVLQATLGPAFVVTKGFGALEVERAYTRARELCLQVGDTSQLFSVLWGVWRLYAARATFQTAQQLGEELLSLAQRQHDPANLLMAHFALGGTLLFQGHLNQAYAYAQQGTGLYDAQRHRSLAFRYGEDPGVACRSYEAFALGLLGYPDQALTRMLAMLALAEELAHPFSHVRALGWLTRLYRLRCEPQAVLEHAETTVSLATQQGFSQWAAQGVIMRGWALATLGQDEEGLDQIHQGLAAYRATGRALRPEVLALLAETYGHRGQGDEGLRLLREALDWAESTGGRWWNAELHRLTGEVLLQQAVPDVPQAEAHVQQALATARQQQAKSLELRAAMSFSRLWQRQGRSAEARQMLMDVYAWFTEGFETADLRQGKILLEALSDV